MCERFRISTIAGIKVKVYPPPSQEIGVYEIYTPLLDDFSILTIEINCDSFVPESYLDPKF